MKEVVINACYGGFGMSKEAVLRWAEVKGRTIYCEQQGMFPDFYTIPVAEFKALKKGQVTNGMYFFESSIDRDDPALVQVVKELGEKVNGRCSKLKVVEIPEDIQWEVTEYDGFESVEEVHRSWS